MKTLFNKMPKQWFFARAWFLGGVEGISEENHGVVDCKDELNLRPPKKCIICMIGLDNRLQNWHRQNFDITRYVSFTDIDTADVLCLLILIRV